MMQHARPAPQDRTQAAIWGMNNNRSENANSPPVAPNLRIPHSVEAMAAAMKRTDAPLLPNVIEHEEADSEVRRLNALINEAAQFRK